MITAGEILLNSLFVSGDEIHYDKNSAFFYTRLSWKYKIIELLSYEIEGDVITVETEGKNTVTR
jgi:hypothetical protein